MSTRDYSSIYDIKDFFVNGIAPKYFDDIEDVSKLNIGLLGMISSINATTTEDVFNAITVYLNEMLPSQATLPEVIYAYAAQYGIDNIFANCAKMPVLLAIKESDVLGNAEVNGDGTMTFVLDKAMTVYIEDIPFSIPYDIIITVHVIKNGNDTTYSYIATYDNSVNNSIADISSNPYMKIIKMTAEGISFIGIKTTVDQYIRKEYHESVISNNKLNIPSFDYSFENDLCNFEVLYTSASTGKTSQCKKLLDTSLPSKNPSCFYKMKGSSDDELLHISFATDDRYFIPEYNSNLTVYTYETLGTDGNFPKYTGDGINVTTSSEIYDYNNSISVFCITMGESSGGSNRLSLNDIKRQMLTIRTTDNSYTTENDLNAYFLNYTSIHGTVCKFFKPRDDYASREFKCYSRLINEGIIYPTNTISLSIPSDNTVMLSNDDNTLYSILSGTKMIYDGDSTDNCIIAPDDTSLCSHVYLSPFQIQVSMIPNSVSCYITSIDKDIELDYTLSNGKSKHQFTASKLHVYRNSNMSYDYEIAFSFVLADFSDTSSSSDAESIEDDKIAVILHFPNKLCYIRLELAEKATVANGSTYTFKGKLTTNNVLHNSPTDSTIELTNMKSLDWTSGMDFVTKEINKVNPDMKVCVLYKYGDTTSANNYNIKELTSYTVTNEFTPEDGMYFAYPMSSIKPTLAFGDLGDGRFSINISGLPVISAKLADDESKWFEFINKLEDQHEYMSNIRNNITAGFTMNMKFYNTYGRSRIFTVDNGSLLNRTDCSFKVSIKFENGVSSEDYIASIKSTIKTVLEQANNIYNGYNEFHASSIISTLVTKFPQIQYIVLNSINDYNSDVQTITMNTDSYDDANTIPEFLTIDMDNIDIIVK